MTDELTDKAKDLAMKNAPWSEGVKWWVVLIQGLLLLAIGLYVTLTDVALRQVVQIIGVFLLVSGALDAFEGIDNRVQPRALPWHMFGSGAAFVTGLLLVVDMFVVDFMGPIAGAAVASFGLLMMGLTGILKWFSGGEHGERKVMDLLVPIGLVLLSGAAIFTRLEAGTDILRWIGILSVIVGIGLLIQTYLLYSRQSKSA